MRIPLFIVLPFLLSSMVSAQHAGHGAPSAYAGEETRAIKSLSDTDIAELRRGDGWGLAKAAELNGMPGPAHLLELKDEIDLSSEQVGSIERVYQEMQQAAIDVGEQLISGEQALEDAFRSLQVDEQSLQILLKSIEESRTHLRFIHLRAHLQTPNILTDEQIDLYNTLRGYAADPCKRVPAGHDPIIWQKHNGCD